MNSCPICQAQLKKEKLYASVTEVRCIADIENHFYGLRLNELEYSNLILKQKIRLRDNNHNLIIVFNHDQQTCDVWRDSDAKKISLPMSPTFQLDFSNPEKIKQKIKTYLLLG